MKKTSVNKLIAGAKKEYVNTPVSLKEKFSYAMGDFGCNMTFSLITTSYFALFWTQYMGLDSNIVGLILILTKIWDAINDTLMGGLIDNVRQKIGVSKFKPWIFWGAFFVTFTAPFCLLPIPSAGLGLKYTVLVVTYLLWNMAYTVVNVPYGSLSSVITSDPLERQSLSTFRSTGTIVAQIITSLLIPVVFMTNNEIDGVKPFWFAVILALLGFVSFMILLSGTKERIIVKERKKEKGAYFKALGGFFKNRSVVFLTLISFVQLIVLLGVQSYAVTFIIQQISARQGVDYGSQLTGIIQAISWIPTLLLAPFIRKLVKRFGKKEIASFPLLLGVLIGALLLVVPIENFNALLAISILVSFSFVVGLAGVTLNMVTWAMIADCIDYQEYKTGVRSEGTIYATYSLGRKFAQALASGGALIVISAVTGYVAENKANQPISVTVALRNMLGISYIIGFGLMFVLIFLGYNLTKKKMSDVQSELEKRHQEALTNDIEDVNE